MSDKVSIIIVNYNGLHLLEECLSAVFSVNYPKNAYEVIVVDNDSQDDSVKFIKSSFPETIVVESQKNLGFSGGNNLGLKYATGKYLVLLNSDTRVDKNWLKYLVETAQEKNVGIVCSKLYYATPFVRLSINSNTHYRANLIDGSDDFSPMGLIVEDLVKPNSAEDPGCWYLSGFYNKSGGNISSRWTTGLAEILIPIKNEHENYQMAIHGVSGKLDTSSDFKIKIDDNMIAEGTIKSNEARTIDIKIKKKDYEKQLIWLVQNTGNAIFKSGLGRDIGAVVQINDEGVREFYDFDCEYYSQKRKVVGLCGASFLIKREVIDKVGLFNDDYFMYYEDTDLGLRAWKCGWDIVFEPKSVVWHKHKGTTSKESTVFFKSLVTKNYLIFLLNHFPIKIFIKKLAKLAIKAVSLRAITFFLEFMKYYGRRYRALYIEKQAAEISLKDVVRLLPRNIRNRNNLRKIQKRSFADLSKHLY